MINFEREGESNRLARFGQKYFLASPSYLPRLDLQQIQPLGSDDVKSKKKKKKTDKGAVRRCGLATCMGKSLQRDFCRLKDKEVELISLFSNI